MVLKKMLVFFSIAESLRLVDNDTSNSYLSLLDFKNDYCVSYTHSFFPLQFVVS